MNDENTRLMEITADGKYQELPIVAWVDDMPITWVDKREGLLEVVQEGINLYEDLMECTMEVVVKYKEKEVTHRIEGYVAESLEELAQGCATIIRSLHAGHSDRIERAVSGGYVFPEQEV